MFALDRSKSGRLKHFPSIGPGSKNVGGHEATQNLPASHEKNPRRVFFASVHKIIATFFNGSFTAYPFRLQRFFAFILFLDFSFYYIHMLLRGKK